MLILFNQICHEIRVAIAEPLDSHIPYLISDADGRTIRIGQLVADKKTHNISIQGMPSGRYSFEAQGRRVVFEKLSELVEN